MAEPYIPAIKDFDFLFKFLFAYFFIQVWGILTGQGRTFEKVPEINRKQIKDIEKKIKKVSETIRNKRQKLQKLQNTKNDDDVDETEEGGQVQAPWKQGDWAWRKDGWGYGLAGGGGREEGGQVQAPWKQDRKSTRLNSSHHEVFRMPPFA